MHGVMALFPIGPRWKLNLGLYGWQGMVQPRNIRKAALSRTVSLICHAPIQR